MIIVLNLANGIIVLDHKTFIIKKQIIEQFKVVERHVY